MPRRRKETASLDGFQEAKTRDQIAGLLLQFRRTGDEMDCDDLKK